MNYNISIFNCHQFSSSSFPTNPPVSFILLQGDRKMSRMFLLMLSRPAREESRTLGLYVPTRATSDRDQIQYKISYLDTLGSRGIWIR